MNNLPDIKVAGQLKNVLLSIYDQSRSLYQQLLIEQKPIAPEEINTDTHILIEANICRLHLGKLISNFRIYKVYELFVLTDSPDYNGSDRVWYLLEDESLLFAANIPDCTGKKVLDIGSGSGVLAIMAARNHADSVKSIDISPRATYISGFNAAINQITNIEFITVSLNDFNTGAKFDYITFNPPFVPLPDHTNYMLSGSGGRDGLALVHQLLAVMDRLAHPSTALSLISLSPGDEHISLLERLLISKYYGKSVTITSTDVYGEVAPIEIIYKPFEQESFFDDWKNWLASQNYTNMHYLFINIFPASRYQFQRIQQFPLLEDLPESGTWGAMYRVIQNSKSHA